MGLDMYLEKRTYVKNWGHTKKEYLHEFIIKKGGKVVEHINTKRISYIIEEIGYWRKANAIHNWIVKNVQKGNDNFKDYYVSEEDLKKLLDDCEKVKKSLIGTPKKKVKIKSGWASGNDTFIDVEVFEKTELAEELLPLTSGFFFGSTDYDNYYLEDLDNTIEIITNALKEIENGGEIYYSSSW